MRYELRGGLLIYPSHTGLAEISGRRFFIQKKKEDERDTRYAKRALAFGTKVAHTHNIPALKK